MAKIVIPTPNTTITSAWGKSVADAINLDWELGYGERTSPLAIGPGTEATSNTVAGTAPIVLDGRPILVEFFAPAVVLPPGIGSIFNIWFFEEATSLGIASATMSVVAGQGTVPVYGARRLAAPTGTRSYTARAACTGRVRIRQRRPRRHRPDRPGVHPGHPRRRTDVLMWTPPPPSPSASSPWASSSPGSCGAGAGAGYGSTCESGGTTSTRVTPQMRR